MIKRGLSPFGRANLQPRWNPLDGQIGFLPQPRSDGPLPRVASAARGQIIDEYVPPAVPTVHDVVDRARILHSHGARHASECVGVAATRQAPKNIPARPLPGDSLGSIYGLGALHFLSYNVLMFVAT